MGSELGLSSSDDIEPKVRLDGVSIFYIVFAVTWTLCLLGGVGFLLKKRDCQILRVRGIVFSICAVGFLHCYWISVQLGYTFAPVMPGDGEYWIMSTWLPLGVALFHASNSRFLHVARAQKRFVQQQDQQEPDVEERSQMAKGKGLLARFKRLEHTRKVFVLVGVGMLFQVSELIRRI